MAKIRSVSVQKVIAVLKKAGFQKGGTSVWDWTRGFVARRHHDGTVRVYYENPRVYPKVPPVEPERYADALRNAGVECHIEESTVICTGIKEEESPDPQQPQKEE